MLGRFDAFFGNIQRTPPPQYKLAIKAEDGIPAPVLYMPARLRAPSDSLFRLKYDTHEIFTARLIPYVTFADRGRSDMIAMAK